LLFNSVEYLIFLPVVLGTYYVLSRRGQNVWLLLASLFFYGWWDWRFLSLIALSIFVDFFCGKAISDSKDEKHRRRFLYLSLFTNLGVLGFFKYFNFFYASATSLVESLGFGVTPIFFKILLPMGISFYTFQTMAYTIDIYRGKQKPSDSFLNFALYVSYFPQLVAGPIERASRLLPQFEKKRTVTADNIADGSVLLVLGFFKKIAVADVVAPVVNQVFSNPEHYGATTLLLSVYLFAIQIYCDFSGYTDIARGTSKLLGIDLIENFRHPYFAVSITEFWRKWHMSLSSWLKDYLYIPLGGNRYGKFNTYRNLFITMLLGGLWHGASWNFVIWGAIHGVFLAIHKMWNDSDISVFRSPTFGGGRRAESNAAAFFSSGISMIATFNLVCFAWIFFRADDFASASTMINGIISASWSLSLGLDPWMLVRMAFPLACLVVVEVLQSRHPETKTFRTLSMTTQVFLLSSLLFAIVVFGAFHEEVPFIYFQF
jgi:alginate O-acetyltransferase complex protein AlgI